MATPSTQARSQPGGQQPLGQRLATLAQTLQFGWFIGHLILLLCTLRYTISFVRFNTNTATANFVYRLAFISAAATYGIVVYKAYRARIKQGGIGMQQIQGTAFAMLGDENVQYLIMALIWLCSKSIFLAMLPFTIYSTFHFLTYLRTALIPTLLPSPPPPYPTSPGGGSSPDQKRKTPSAAPNWVSDTISKFVKSHYDTSMMIVANLEIALLVRLILGCLIFVNSWMLLIVYAVFLRIRVGQSAFLRSALVSTEVRIDALLADGRVPPAVRDGWRTAKEIIKKFGAATNVADATGGKIGGTPSVARPTRKTD